MTGATFQLQVEDERLQAALADMAARAEDLSEPFDVLGMALTVSTQRRFELGEDPQGNTWPPSLRALAEDGRTLVESAVLFQSITHRAGPQELEVGTNVVYAAIHQLGGQAGRGRKVRIPARPYLGLDAADEDEIAATLVDWLSPGAEA